jgi:hypothetical protein
VAVPLDRAVLDAIQRRMLVQVEVVSVRGPDLEEPGGFRVRVAGR